VLPCFNDLEKALANIFQCLAPGGKALIGYNIGMGNLEQSIKYIMSNNCQNIHGRARFQQLSNQLFMVENALRIDEKRLEDACARIGYRRVVISPNPFDTSHLNAAELFDIVLEK
jgi:hypothetical protein